MNEFTLLLAKINRVFPALRLEPVAPAELDALRGQFPGVPKHYLEFLRQVGYGSLGDNFMLYSGLCEPDDIFDTETAADLPGIVFFGDNFAGWMVGFDTHDDWRIVGVDSAAPSPHPQEARTVAEFLTQRIADYE